MLIVVVSAFVGNGAILAQGQAGGVFAWLKQASNKAMHGSSLVQKIAAVTFAATIIGHSANAQLEYYNGSALGGGIVVHGHNEKYIDYIIRHGRFPAPGTNADGNYNHIEFGSETPTTYYDIEGNEVSESEYYGVWHDRHTALSLLEEEYNRTKELLIVRYKQIDARSRLRTLRGEEYEEYSARQEKTLALEEVRGELLALSLALKEKNDKFLARLRREDSARQEVIDVRQEKMQGDILYRETGDTAYVHVESPYRSTKRRIGYPDYGDKIYFVQHDGIYTGEIQKRFIPDKPDHAEIVIVPYGISISSNENIRGVSIDNHEDIGIEITLENNHRVFRRDNDDYIELFYGKVNAVYDDGYYRLDVIQGNDSSGDRVYLQDPYVIFMHKKSIWTDKATPNY